MQNSTNLVAKFIIKTEAIQQVENSNQMCQKAFRMLIFTSQSQTNAITNVSALIKSPLVSIFTFRHDRIV